MSIRYNTFRGMDEDFSNNMILVDLQKDSHTLNHVVLLLNMECIGFKESVIKCSESYLPNRKCFVALEHILFRWWTAKLWCCIRIFLRSFCLRNICKWFTICIKRNWTIPLQWRCYLLTKRPWTKYFRHSVNNS